MAAVGTLTIEMAANVARLQRDMDSAKRTVESSMRDIRGFVGSAQRALGALGLAFGSFQFGRFVQNVADVADQAGKMAQRIGVATEQIAGLQLAFRLGGVEANQMQTAMVRLAQQASTGNKAFEAMGISVRDADGALKATNVLLAEVADKIASYRDGAEKTALMIELFGRAGAELIPVLNGGSAAFAKAEEQAKAFGLTISGNASKAAQEFNDQLTLLKAQATGFGRSFALPIITALNDLISKFNEARAAGLSFYDATATTVRQTLGTLGPFEELKQRYELIANLRAELARLQAPLATSAFGTEQRDTAQIEALKQRIEQERRAALFIEQRMNLESDSNVMQREIATRTAPAVAAATANVNAEYERLIETLERRAREGRLALQAEERGLTDIQKEILLLLNSPLWKDMPESFRRQVTNRYIELANIERRVLADAKLRKDTLQDLADDAERAAKSDAELLKKVFELMDQEYKKHEDLEKTRQDYLSKRIQLHEQEDRITKDQIDNAADLLRSITEETTLLKLSNEERSVKVAMLRLERAGIVEGTAAYKEYAEKIKAAILDQEAVASSIREAQRVAQEWDNIKDQISDSLASAIVNGGREGAEYLKRIFRNLILRPTIRATLFGSGAGGAASTSAAAQAGGGAGGSFLGTAIGSIGTFGKFVGSGLNVAMTQGVGAGVSAGQAAMASGSTAAGLGIQVGAVLPAAIAVVAVAALLKKGLSKTLVDQGIEGMLSVQGLDGRAFDFFKGGFLRGNKTVSKELDQEMAEGIQFATSTIGEQTKAYAKALALPADALDSFSQEIKLSFMGLEPEQIEQKIEKSLGLFSDALATQLSGSLQEVSRRGETASQTLKRLADSINIVNPQLRLLGAKQFEIGIQGAEAASKLIDEFGGEDIFLSLTRDFFQKYYSEAERATLIQEELTDVFSKYNKSLPTSLLEFRDLAASLDLTTDSGRKASAALMFVQATFAELIDLQEQIREQAEQEQDRIRRAVEKEFMDAMREREDAASFVFRQSQQATDRAVQALERAANAQLKAAEAARQAAQEQVSAIRSVFDLLRSSVQDLYREAGGTAAFTAAAGRSFIEQALRTARATGYLPEADTLREAIAAARGGFGGFQTSFEAERSRLVLAGQLSQLQAISGVQLTAAEQQLLAAVTQVEQLNNMLQLQRDQVNALRGVDVSVRSVEVAILQLAQSMQREQSAATQLAVVQAAAQQKQAEAVAAQAAAPAGPYVPADIRSKTEFEKIAFYAVARSSGFTDSQIRAAVESTLGSAEKDSDWNYLKTKAGYARGGLFGGGMRMVGETGPEIEVTGPARYMSYTSTQSMIGNALMQSTNMAEEMRGLREDNKAQSRAIVSLQSRMTRLLERWDGDGLPEERAVA